MAQDPNSPLKALYSDVNDMPVLMYPHDLGTTRKGHFITFSVLIPTKSTYKPTTAANMGGVGNTVGATNSTFVTKAQTQLNSAATTASQASSMVSSVASTVGTIATAANEVLTTASQVAAAGVAAVGIVSGTISSVTNTAASSSGITGVVGTASQLVAGASALSSLASTVGNIPGVSSFLNDPMQAASDTFDSIKNFLNSPDKAASSAAEAVTQGIDVTFSTPVLKPKGYINLYMPDTVSMAQHAVYGDISMTEALGAIGGGIEGYQEGPGAVASAAKTWQSITDNWDANDVSGSAIRTMKTAGQVDAPLALEGAGAAAGALGVVNNAGSVSKFLLKNAGYAMNPGFEVIFTAMDFRKFQFDFTFTPKSKAEAATIREIIKLFRLHASPSNPATGSGRYFVTPSVFQINYMHLESHNDNLHKFAPCVLETVIVDYAPEVGWVTYTDGMPVKTRMTLQFKETEIITQESIDKEGY